MSFTLKIEKNREDYINITVDEVQDVDILSLFGKAAVDKFNEMSHNETQVMETTLCAVVRWRDMNGDYIETPIHNKTNVYVVNSVGVTVNTYRTL